VGRCGHWRFRPGPTCLPLLLAGTKVIVEEMAISELGVSKVAYDDQVCSYLRILVDPRQLHRHPTTVHTGGADVAPLPEPVQHAHYQGARRQPLRLQL
jgi:hypothetical protein